MAKYNYKMILIILFVIFITLNGFGVGSVYAGTYGGGSGTEGDPFIISDPNHMQEIGTNSGDWDKNFLLTADIDLSAYTGTSFNIIGLDTLGDIGFQGVPFTGVFDGNGHTISNFTYTSMWRRYIGLFGYIDDSNAVIKNLSLINPSVDAGSGGFGFVSGLGAEHFDEG